MKNVVFQSLPLIARAFSANYSHVLTCCPCVQLLITPSCSSGLVLTNSMAYGTHRFNAAGIPKGLFPVGVPVKIFEGTPTFSYSGYMTYPSHSSTLNHPVYIRGTVQTMKFLIAEPSPLPILFPLGLLLAHVVMCTIGYTCHDSLT